MYRSDAFFRLGMSFTLSGNYQAGKLCFHNLASGGNDNLEEDEYASFMAGQFLQAPPGPAAQALFRARNLYDGGYYDKALDILKRLTTQVNTLSDDERTELYYRYARIYHTLGEAAKARTAYRQCIDQPAVHQKWLQAYAHFFLGDLAREEGNNTMARTHFEEALAYDDYFYQAGLENRCKIALYDLKQ
jgi:tetratricopeptide (TPR) repeat protein